MAFVSYAQNFEDVILWRVLKHIECGFYIDVGANDPEIDSVTKAFYDRGWRGINVEPVPQWFDRLQEKRLRDINLQLAAGTEKGELVLYELPDTGLSTIEKTTAERHETERGYTKIERIVPVETLTAICECFHVAPIHFLKIDVEGAEKDVLVGLDLSIIRPWIILVESTLPNTQVEDYAQWDPLIRAANYDCVYFDGLNRYYVAQEHEDLKAHFNAPPNFFDGFMLSGLASHPFYKLVEAKSQEQERRAEAAEGRAQQAEARIHQTEANLAQSSQEFQALHQANHYHWQLAEERNQYSQALLNSISWRITAPLRSMGRAVIWLRGQAAMPQSSPYNAQSALRRTAVSIVNWGVSYAQKAPRFRRVVLTVLNRMPGLAIKLRQMHIQSQFAPHPHHGDWSGNQTPMPAGQTSPISSSDVNRLHSIPLSNGINARQRTPLEAYFHVYRGSE